MMVNRNGDNYVMYCWVEILVPIQNLAVTLATEEMTDFQPLYTRGLDQNGYW